MAQGILEIRGRIPLDQFWPEGDLDADVTSLKVEVGDSAFRFRAHPGVDFRMTHAFRKARVHGRISRPIVDERGCLTVRLQGVDAPELHFAPVAACPMDDQTAEQRSLFLEWSHSYRQHLAESAMVALRSLLESEDGDHVPCRVVTAVEQPSDAIDCLGRLVGDLEVQLDLRSINVNRWLTTRGWTVPAFYCSMTSDEIRTLHALGDAARRKGLGLWPHLTPAVGALDFDLQFRKRPSEDDPSDLGWLLMPKLFRRLCSWSVNRRAGIERNGLPGYLDRVGGLCYPLAEFLDQGPSAARPRSLSAFIGPRGALLAGPLDLVFHESPATLIGPHGKPPTW